MTASWEHSGRKIYKERKDFNRSNTFP